MSVRFDDSVKYDVYLGTWTNWSRGSVLGYTLTLSREDGNLLVAFIAFFVAYVGTRLWRILCLAFHMKGSSPQSHEAPYYQRQAVLRNTSTAEDGIYRLLSIVWAWGNSSRRVWLSTLPALAMAVVCAAGFVVASGFSSQISSSVGNEVLLSGTNCAWVDNNGDSNATQLENIGLIWRPYESRIWMTSANYAQECYNKTGSPGFLSCSTFIKKQLPFTVDVEAGCPFADGMCSTNNSNIILDSGYLDSHDHFGINAPTSQRTQWRKVMHCAPLMTEGYKEKGTSTTSKPVTKYFYGKARNTRDYEDYTYQYVDERYWGLDMTSAEYTIGLACANPMNGSIHPRAPFRPIKQLWRPDGDLNVVFLSSNGMPFLQRTLDEWYRATVPGPNITMDRYHSGLQSYTQDEAASPLACVEQQQLCFFESNGTQVCTPLGPINDIPQHTEALVGDRARLNYFIWMFNVLTSPSNGIGDLVSTLGGSLLLARSTMSSNAQGILADNQWQLEVQHWFATHLANAQQAFVRAAIGPSPELREFSTGPASAESHDMCRNQKITTTGYASFSMFGILFVIITGGIIVILSYALEPIIAFLYRRRKLGQYVYLEWASNSTLQIQRLANQGLGFGTWSGALSEVPTTKPGEKLALLDITNPEMPVLGAPQETDPSVSLHTSQAATQDISQTGFDEDASTVNHHHGTETPVPHEPDVRPDDEPHIELQSLSSLVEQLAFDGA
ncbi:hypothetical protein F5X99DRAFT_423614 [Biscogniauxia marginata]|nr:hypothetical protein F5X99DRAFT_423614 [Biscogniauxia marginata]